MADENGFAATGLTTNGRSPVFTVWQDPDNGEVWMECDTCGADDRGVPRKTGLDHFIHKPCCPFASVERWH
jgi:hypothetical protein